MARYEVRVDLVGSSTDVERSFTALADAAEDTADRLEDAFADTSDTVTGQLSGLADDGSTALSGIGDAAEESAGRISDVFTDTTGKVSAGLDDLAGTAGEKAGVIADSFDGSFGTIGDLAETATGKINLALDGAAGTADETAGLISASFEKSFGSVVDLAETTSGKIGTALDGAAGAADEKSAAIADGFDKSFATVGQSAGALGARYGAVLDAMVAQTTEKAALLSARLDEAFAKGGLAASKLAAGSGAASAGVGTAAVEEAEKGNSAVEGIASVGKWALLGTLGAAYGSYKLSDEYDTALAQLKTSVMNAKGHPSWAQYQGSVLPAAENQGQRLGFADSDVVGALATLTTATNNPKEAFGKLALAEDLARAKSIPLSDAAQALAKVYGGSTRVLAQYGVQVNVASDKLHSIQTETEAVQKAQLVYKEAVQAATQQGVVGSQNYTQAMLTEQSAANSLAEAHVSGSNAVANALENWKTVQGEVASGQVKGAEAVGALQKSHMDLTEAIESGGLKNTAAALAYEKAQDSVANTTEKDSYAQVVALEKVQEAQMSLADAQSNLKESKDAIPTIFAALNQRFQGEAGNYIRTLPGQIKVVEVAVEDLGKDFGEFLTPKLEAVGHDLEGVADWLKKNKGDAEALGYAITGVLGVAMTVYAEQKVAKFVEGTGKMIGDLHKLEQGAVSVAQKILHIGQGSGSSPSTTEGKVGGLGQSSDTTAGQVQGLGDNSETAAGQVSQLGSNSETAAGQVRGLGDASTEAAGTVTTDSATMETSIKGIGPSAEITEDTVSGSMIGMEGATDTAAAGMDAAIGSTGIGAILIGLSIGATLLATHWKAVWGFVKEAAEDTWHFLDRDVVRPLEKDLSHLKGEAEDLEKGWKVVWKDVKDAAEDAWHFIDHDIFQPLVRGAGRLRTDVVSDFGKVTGFLKGIPGDIEHLFSDAGTWLLDAGKNLLEGLWKGVSDESGKVLKDVEGVGKHVLHAITHPWEIFSPSHATQRAGVYLMQGISVGVKSEEAKVLSDVAKIGQDVKVELGKIGTLGQDVGIMFMTDFAKGITSHAGLLANALAQVEKEAKSSAMQQLHGQQLGGVAGGGPGGSTFPSMTTHWEVNIDKLVAQNPNDMARQLKVKQRQANLVRT